MGGRTTYRIQRMPHQPLRVGSDGPGRSRRGGWNAGTCTSRRAGRRGTTRSALGVSIRTTPSFDRRRISGDAKSRGPCGPADRHWYGGLKKIPRQRPLPRPINSDKCFGLLVVCYCLEMTAQHGRSEQEPPASRGARLNCGDVGSRLAPVGAKSGAVLQISVNEIQKQVCFPSLPKRLKFSGGRHPATQPGRPSGPIALVRWHCASSAMVKSSSRAARSSCLPISSSP